MNVKRFTARTSREALALIRQALGNDAVVLSTKPCAEGVEVLAMAPEGLQQIEAFSVAPAVLPTPAPQAPPAGRAAARPAAKESAVPRPPAEAAGGSRSGVGDDVARLSMSTLSFQDYVRERMLRRRQALLDRADRTHDGGTTPSEAAAADFDVVATGADAGNHAPAVAALAAALSPSPATRLEEARAAAVAPPHDTPAGRRAGFSGRGPASAASDWADLSDEGLQTGAWPAPAPAVPAPAARPPSAVLSPDPLAPSTTASRRVEGHAVPHAGRDNLADMLSELRSVRGLIEHRFDSLAFIEKLQRQPVQARLIQKLLDCGFSPALIRKLSDSLPPHADLDIEAGTDDDTDWAAGVLQRNLLTAEADSPLEDQGGVYALIGSTGVGKTTTTAKLAAAFAAKYGATHLGLITLDAYRVAAHEQLRAYGRILGVPVHTAHDRSSLEDLLDLLSAKKMVLIDTAGMAQRDTRTRELLEMIGHRSIQRLLVVNSAAQGETIEDVMLSYRAATCVGVVLSKMDEAVKLGPALDAAIRHKTKIVGVANGQRVPEDWHRLSAQALLQRALNPVIGSAWRMDSTEVSLVLAGTGRPAALAV